jgi:hypothetical protein
MEEVRIAPVKRAEIDGAVVDGAEIHRNLIKH